MSAEEQMKRELIALLPRLRRYAMTLTRSWADADDLVQETCWKALSNAAQWDQSQELSRWVFRIARNHWISELRKQKVRKGEGQIPAEEASELVSRADGESNIAGQEVYRSVLDLPKDLATVLLLVSVEGYSYKEAAEELDIPIGTVMSRISRARKALRARNKVMGTLS